MMETLEEKDRTEEIQRLINACHRGKENAIKIDDLFKELKSYFPDLKRREMRRAYEMLVLCWGRDGIYAPATEAEKLEQIERNKKLIRAYAAEIKRIRGYEIKNEIIQIDLF